MTGGVLKLNDFLICVVDDKLFLVALMVKLMRMVICPGKRFFSPLVLILESSGLRRVGLCFIGFADVLNVTAGCFFLSVSNLGSHSAVDGDEVVVIVWKLLLALILAILLELGVLNLILILGMWLI